MKNYLLIKLNILTLYILELMINHIPPSLHNMTVPTLLTDSLITLAEKLEIVINKSNVEKEVAL